MKRVIAAMMAFLKGFRLPYRCGKAYAAACLAVAFLSAASHAAAPASLKSVPVPEPARLGELVADRGAAIRLGKALFWDMQVGSDGMTACATCHFHAGTDHRTRNSLNPGGDGRFTAGPNGVLAKGDFPLFKHQDPHSRFSAVIRNNDDIVGAQGVTRTSFAGTRQGNGVDAGRTVRDPLFTGSGRNVRQTTGRNAPSVINAVFNFANFWDGRANHFFNGVNPFGIQDVNAAILVNNGGTLEPVQLGKTLENASLASQAVGPPLSDVEMSWIGRSFPDLGRKMLPLTPLAGQLVLKSDSVLGAVSRHPAKGIAGTYEGMIKAAFHSKYWDSGRRVNGYTQMEANFALFFGLAVQMYEATLVADDTPFDRFVAGDFQALTERQQRGMNIFFSGQAGCLNCHVGAEFTGATVSLATAPGEPGLVELMAMGDGNLANYDIGFYNIGVTPTGADPGRGGRDPFGFPLSFSRQNFEPVPFEFPKPGCVNDFLFDPPTICPPAGTTVSRVAVDGAFKTPGLRNVELTGPYFHNGGMTTLRQVVDFYIRGGNFREANLADLDPFINDINGLKGESAEADRDALVDFLLALTDERVRWEMAPFDHPQLMVPNGHTPKVHGNPKRTRVLKDILMEIPAVGAAGRQSLGLPPLRPFLNDTGDPAFHFTP